MFMFRKMLLATTATILLTGTALAAPIDTNGPSFDCSYAKTTLAQILCAGSDAAQEDKWTGIIGTQDYRDQRCW